MDIRINQTLQSGAVRKPHLPFYRLVGTVSNCAYAVRLETAPTGGASVYLFLEFTIVSRIIHQIQVAMSRQTSLRQPLLHLQPRVQSAR